MWKFRLESKLVVVFCTMIAILATVGYSVPQTISIQGQLAQGDGTPLTGIRIYSVKFFDAAVAGAQIGTDLTGAVTVSSAGRFAIEVVPPAAALSQSTLYYELGIDSAGTPDGTVDPADVYPVRVLVHSVMFARQAEKALTADSATNAVNANALDGKVANGFWQVGGNAGLTSPALIGTTDNVVLQLIVNNKVGLEIQPNEISNNILANPEFNTIAPCVTGAGILSGGDIFSPNSVTRLYGTVAGGQDNTASLVSFVGGGGGNSASGSQSVAVGGFGNSAIGGLSFVGGGFENSATGQHSTVGGGSNNSANGERSFSVVVLTTSQVR